MTFRFSTSTAVFAALALTAAACSHEEAKPLDRPTVSAASQVVQMSSITSTRAVAGTIRSTTISPLSAKVIGNVIRVNVSEGDAVRKGQVLIEIDAREARAQGDRARAGGDEVERAIDAARANASLAEATFRRYAALREKKSVSPQEFDQAKAQHEAAQAQLAQATARRGEARAMASQAATFLDYSAVRSPIDGIVTSRNVDPGTQAAPGMLLMTVEDPRAFRAEATVPEDLAVKPGDPVAIETGAARIEAKVTRIQPSLDSDGRSALVKIDLPPSAQLRSGSYARVVFATGQRSALTLPPGSIVRRGQLTSVFVVGDDGVARMRLITVGENDEVLSGLDAGERVVTEPQKVRDGVKVS